jgi:hypothetical protein
VADFPYDCTLPTQDAIPGDLASEDQNSILILQGRTSRYLSNDYFLMTFIYLDFDLRRKS